MHLQNSYHHKSESLSSYGIPIITTVRVIIIIIIIIIVVVVAVVVILVVVIIVFIFIISFCVRKWQDGTNSLISFGPGRGVATKVCL